MTDSDVVTLQCLVGSADDDGRAETQGSGHTGPCGTNEQPSTHQADDAGTPCEFQLVAMAEAPPCCDEVDEPNEPLSLRQELRATIVLAGPVVFTYLLQMGLGLINVAAVGRLGVLELDGAALGQLTANITGNSIVFGLLMAMDTLAPQAHGAGSMKLVGTIAQRAVLIACATSVPILLLWWNIEPLLLLAGQSPEVSATASTYLRVLSVGVLPNFITEVAKKYLQAQNVVVPVTVIMAITLAFDAVITYLLIWPLGLGFEGAPLALSVSQIFAMLSTLLYIRFWHGCCHSSPLGSVNEEGPLKCWGGWTWDSCKEWRAFLKLGLPSVAQLCAEWWAFEVISLEAGILGEVDLASSSVLVQVIAFAFMVPLGVSIAASTRVGQHLGAGHAEAAARASKAALLLVSVLSCVTCVLLVALREQCPRAFTENPAVVELVSKALCFMAVAQLFDSVQVTLAGILRGAGLQALGAWANLIAQWGVGVPTASFGAFVLNWGFYGLWAGLAIGMVTQCALEGAIVARIDWHKMVEAASAMSARGAEADGRLKAHGDEGLDLCHADNTACACDAADEELVASA